MPLRVVSDTGNVHAFEFDAPRWTELKQSYRSMGLRMPCCGSSVVPKTSALGNYFFAHSRKGECTTSPESPEHLYCKQLIAQAAQSAGWAVTTEMSGVSPSGEEWVADVFCEKGSAKIAFEVQMSPQKHEETIRRQLRYKASGVRGAWFYSSRVRPDTVAIDKDTPAFVLSPVEVGQVPTIYRFDIPLPEFVAGMLNKRLVWTVPESSRPLQVEFLPDTCWTCHKQVKQVYGYLESLEDAEGEWHERAFTVASLSTALEKVQEVISNDDLAAQGLNLVGTQAIIRGKVTNWPYCNVCLHCRAPQNNFHLGKKLRAEWYGMTSDQDDRLHDRLNDNKYRETSTGVAPIARIVKGRGCWVFNSGV